MSNGPEHEGVVNRTLDPEPASPDDGARPRSVAANSVSMVFAQTLAKVLGFAVALVLTRSVSVEEYGRYAFAIAFAALFLPLADPGVDFHTTRMVSRHPERANAYLGSALVLKALLLPLVLLVSLPVAWASGHRGATLQLVAIAVLGGWLLVLHSSYLAVFRGLRRMDIEARITLGTRGAAFVLSLLAIIASGGVAGVLLGQMLAAASGVPLGAWFAGRLAVRPRLAAFRELGREMLVGGLAFAATSLLVMAYFRIDMLMLSHMKGEHSVGLYGAGVNVMFAAFIASQALVLAVFPVIARAASLADREVRNVVRRALTLSLVVSLPFAVGAWIVPGPVLALLYGAPYAEGAGAFRWLMLALPLIFVTNLVGNCLGAVGRQREVMVVAGVNLIVNVALNLLLIPRYDLAGSALATVLTECCGLVMLAFALRRDLPAMLAPGELARVAMACAALAGILMLVRTWPIVAVLAVGAATWVVMMIALRLVRSSDLRTLGGGDRAAAS